jgi:hypothetical protein
MVSSQTQVNQFQKWVRPGLLLFVFSVLALAVFDKAGLAKSLAGPSAVKCVVLVVTISVTALGWFLLCMDSNTLQPRYKWITLTTAVVLTLSIADFSLFDVVPVRLVVRFNPVHTMATMLLRSPGYLVVLAWLIPFFGRGRSRTAFVIGSTLTLFLWASTSGTLSSPVYGWF